MARQHSKYHILSYSLPPIPLALGSALGKLAPFFDRTLV